MEAFRLARYVKLTTFTYSRVEVLPLVYHSLVMAGQLTGNCGIKSLAWKHFGLLTNEGGVGIQPNSPVCRFTKLKFERDPTTPRTYSLT